MKIRMILSFVIIILVFCNIYLIKNCMLSNVLLGGALIIFLENMMELIYTTIIEIKINRTLKKILEELC